MTVGELGTPLTGVAVALLVKSKGGHTVSVTVSVCKVGVDNTIAAGSSQFSGSSTGRLVDGPASPGLDHRPHR